MITIISFKGKEELLIILPLFIYGWGDAHATVDMWMSEDSLEKSVLFFYYAGCKDWTQVIRFLSTEPPYQHKNNHFWEMIAEFPEVESITNINLNRKICFGIIKSSIYV